MGTEISPFISTLGKTKRVKLNNPQMGTETGNRLLLHHA